MSERTKQNDVSILYSFYVVGKRTHTCPFLGAFARLRKASVSFFVSVRTSAWTTRLPLDTFSWCVMFEYFSKVWPLNWIFILIWPEYRILYMKNNVHFLYLAQFFLEWEIFQTKLVEKIKTHILCPIRGNMGKYFRAGRTGDCNMSHAHCMQDTKGYKHTLRTCNTAFSTAMMVARTRLNVTLYVSCLSCLLISSLHFCPDSFLLFCIRSFPLKVCHPFFLF